MMIATPNRTLPVSSLILMLFCILGFPDSSCSSSSSGLYIRGRSPLRQILNRVPRQQSEAPQISMRSTSRHWLQVQCTVPRPSASFKVFVSCPITNAPCYENCIPTTPCGEGIETAANCLPDRETVNCTQETLPSGASITTLWIDNRDKKLHGQWSCANLGIRSSSVEITPLTEEKPQPSPAPLEPLPPANPISSKPIYANQEKSIETSENSNETPLHPTNQTKLIAFASFLSQSPWIFCILAIFTISLAVNIILWSRWCILCIFTARRRKGTGPQKALGDMLCLPTAIQKSQSALWDNAIFPGALSDGHPVNGFDDPNQRFATFGPSSYYFDGTLPQPNQQNSSFNDLTFPQFNTMQPGQPMWTSRSNVPTSFAATSVRVNRPRSGRDSLRQLSSSTQPQIIDTPGTQYADLMSTPKEPKRFPRVSMTPPVPPPPLTHGNLYDDVASSSTITTLPKATMISPFGTPQLPAMMEQLESTSSTGPSIYTVHERSPKLQSFGRNDGGVLNN